MYIVLIISIILIEIIYILYKKYNNHYWYNVFRNLNEKQYYNHNDFKNGAVIEKNIDNVDINDLITLYKNYFPSFNITKTTILNFFKLENPAIIYKRNNNIIASVFNSINEVVYNNKIMRVNFVDYAIVDKKMRNNNIFQGLMNEVANYTNMHKSPLIMFKIDLTPIPSFLDYNFTSNYYSAIKRNFTTNVTINDFNKDYYPKINNFLKKYQFHPILKEKSNLANILINDDQRKTIVIDGKIVFNLKYNSSDFLEILYVFCLEENNYLVKEGIKYINQKYNFKYLFIDSIGYNINVIDIMGNYFKEKHKTYHYILGVKEKLEPKNVYYYF